jgi:hypothetical protein
MSRSWPVIREQVALAIEAVTIVTDGVDVTWAPHVLRQPVRAPVWEGHYNFLLRGGGAVPG